MGPKIEDSFAEAFPMAATRLAITADDAELARIASEAFCGNASSVIGCDLEAGIAEELDASQTIDGRPGISVLAFAFSRSALESAVVGRVGQNVLTCPSTACYADLSLDAIAAELLGKPIKLGAQLRYFGDGNQIAKKLGSRRYWRVPTMDGEFVIDDVAATCKGIGGGNLIVTGSERKPLLAAARKAADTIAKLPNVILPFPSGVVRSGSKVGSKYPQLTASTNDKWCPSLKGSSDSNLTAEENAVYEIVIDGLSEVDVAEAMKVGIASLQAEAAVCRITAGNYGGKLGPYHFHLRDLAS
ncbi:MAG: formylmethanofuran--tetrahydromethanopterin N-formyltransferase [Planctomycetota bacterium]|nr:formylmethanofuran--tetrahydromethanopterin N-formyltransferase [Planctomycetota bacterium]